VCRCPVSFVRAICRGLGLCLWSDRRVVCVHWIVTVFVRSSDTGVLSKSRCPFGFSAPEPEDEVSWSERVRDAQLKVTTLYEVSQAARL